MSNCPTNTNNRNSNNNRGNGNHFFNGSSFLEAQLTYESLKTIDLDTTISSLDSALKNYHNITCVSTPSLIETTYSGTPLSYVQGGDIQSYNNNQQLVLLNDGKFPQSPGGVGYTITGPNVQPNTTVTGYRMDKSNPSSRYNVIFMDLSKPLSGIDASKPVYYSAPAIPKFCGNYGRPSSDRNIRIYTQNECESVLNGLYNANGECTKRGGGSYSWDCKALNFPRAPKAPPPIKVTGGTCNPSATNLESKRRAVESAFAPIAEYYTNVTKLNTILQNYISKASSNIVESDSVLTSQERYTNRIHPEDTMLPRESMLPELRISSIPYILAISVFMASLSIFLIFQLNGIAGQLVIPNSLVTLFTFPADTVPFYENPMILGGVGIILIVSTIIFATLYFRSKNTNRG